MQGNSSLMSLITFLLFKFLISCLMSVFSLLIFIDSNSENGYSLLSSPEYCSGKILGLVNALVSTPAVL